MWHGLSDMLIVCSSAGEDVTYRNGVLTMHRALRELELIAIIIGGLILSSKRDNQSFPVRTGHSNSMLLVQVSRFRKDVSVPAG